jgi:hypothetical protein
MSVPDATFIFLATERNWPPLTLSSAIPPENSGGHRALDAAHASNNRVIKP